MHHRPLLMLAALAAASGATPAWAAGGMPWRAEPAAFAFRFGNEIDTHQRSRVERDGSLSGWLFVRATGTLTSDGYPIATHADCRAVSDCYAGWKFDARPARATLVRQPMHDHPLFWIPRPDLPQPGAFAHFHWTGAAMPMPYQPVDGYVMALKALQRFCFIHHMADAAMPSLSCRQNGGVAVEPGIDVASHLNIVTSDPSGM